MGNKDKISLKPVKKFSGKKFFIPKYQRGYRWTKRQVEDLLYDLDSFELKNKSSCSFYCLQPLVVRKMTKEDKKKIPITGAWYEVIDGQQRLTTIFLIIKYLEEYVDNENFHFYELDYHTRRELKEFLKNIKDKIKTEEKTENIDFFHMWQAYETIKDWFDSFKDKKEEKKKEFLKKLLDNVKFIWYETDETDPIEVFTRLNIGKIPLTNAELIKALLLKRSNFKGQIGLNAIKLRQQEIAGEWDNIEKTLQDDEFWFFVHDTEYKKPTRIDFIFDLIFDENKLKLNLEDQKNDKGKDEYKTFRYFYDYFNKLVENEEEKDKIKKIWSEVKKIFSVFKEWHDDLTLYHYVGYLIDQGIKVEDLIKKWEAEKSKKSFIDDYLVEEIKNKIKKCNDLSEQYEEDKCLDKTKCRPLLLLYNVQTVINQGENAKDKYGRQVFYKFPFHIYKKEGWDIEHIDSNTENALEDKDTQDEWLLNVLEMVKNKEIKQKIDEFCNNKNDNDEERIKKFNGLKKEVLNALEIDEKNKLGDKEKNQIMNFALLDSSTNRSYGNAIFAAKRRIIIGKDRGKAISIPQKKNGKTVKGKEEKSSSSFVPPCTQHVFLKYYSSKRGDPNCWNKEDAKSYREDISDTLKKFGVKSKTKVGEK